MHISFSPQRRDDTLAVSKLGDILTINGEVFDFSELPDDATIPAGEVPCEWIAGPVERIDGILHLTLLLPHGAEPVQGQAFPSDIINPPDGAIDIPWNTYVETEEQATPGGKLLIVKTYRWGEAPAIETVFMPDTAVEEEHVDVEA